MQWYYADAGRQVGPLDDTAFQELVNNGTVRDDTPVWKEGMADWQPYGTVRPPRPAAPPPPAAPVPPPAAAPETAFCTQCGGRFPKEQLAMVGNRQMCGGCRQAATPQPQPAAPAAYTPQPAPQPGYNPQQGYTPAPATPIVTAPIDPNAAAITPFGAPTATWANRAIGYLIDSIFVMIAMVILGTLGSLLFGSMIGLGALGSSAGGDLGAVTSMLGGSSCCFFLVLFPVSILGVGIYNKVYLLSKRGFSIGQGVMKIKIVDRNGNKLTFGTAFIRLLAQVGLGIIPFVSIVDLLWPLWDVQRQTLHDKAVGSFAIQNPSGQ
jgi:uncharacterized RDD family membrane protein YckC